ncbi:MG2 domain-containing protein [Chryseobacterium sp. C39-AII1]|uniref:alpha-2-macroglobulin family protein n=1 Tax=Chryseobacterium sp. C39-AII1 TaxID=3080332 RepID=UPI003207DF95
MKNICKCVLLFFIFSCSFLYSQNYYEDQWKKIAEGYNSGNVKSSLPIVIEIQNQAIKEKNATQLIRSLKMEFAIYKETKDDPKNDYASAFFTKIEETEKRLSIDDLLLFKVLEIEFFENYFDKRKWDIQNRTNLSDGNLSKIESWTKLDFKNFYTQRFAELSKIDFKLKKIGLEKYKDAFKTESDFEFFPSLYDWKVKKNIDFLNNNYIFTDNELKANRFVISALYQSLINSNDKNPKIYFQHQKLISESSGEDKEDFITQQISLINSPVKADYKIIITKDVVDFFNRKSKFLESVQLIDKMKLEYPNSKFLNNIISQENTIKAPFVELTYDVHNLSEKPIHIVAKHKNADRFTVKIYKVNDFKNNLEYLEKLNYKDFFDKIDKTPVRTDIFSLPNKKDYKTYTTSLAMNPLQKGLYIAEYINSEDISRFLMIVTSSRVIYDQNKNYILLSRENGEIKPNTKLQQYDFRDYSNVSETEILIKTDNFARFAPKVDHYSRTEILYEPDSNDFNLLNNDYEWNNDYRDERPLSQIFLDRQIYRPGQTVNFKVISTYPDFEKKRDALIVDNEQEITLYDANRQVISTQKLKTNSFGSYSGSFVLPKDKMNGEFSLSTSGRHDIRDLYGTKYFSVEEYKRPKFEIIFDTIKNDYKYGETIELKGKALTFSGIPLNNTVVNYEIKRENIRQRYFWWYIDVYNNYNPIIGKVETNDKGEFKIKIDLKKDETKEGIQVDGYTIKATATDINGETQSATTDVNVASVSHYLEAEQIKETSAENEVKLNVSTFNYNGIALDKSYKVKLIQLKQPERVLRNNFKKNIQDLPKLSKEEFLSKFPHDRYDKLDDQKYWETLKTIIDRTEKGKEVNLGKLEAGTYRLLIYNIEGKDSIKAEQDFSVWSNKSLGKNQYPFLKVVAPKKEVQRGSSVTVYAYSAIPEATVNIYLQDGTGKPKFERKKFVNGVISFTFPVSQNKEVVKYNVQFVVAHYNDVQNEYADIYVKKDEDPLKIELTTFRDKLEPNSKEKWSVKITGRNKEKVVAEVLANMYDQSLDKFAVNNYRWSTIYYPPNIIKDFNIENFIEKEYWSKKVNYLERKNVSEPKFNWFDDDVLYNLLIKYGLTTDVDGDGIDDRNDACPTVPGLPEYNGCPKPKNVTALELESSFKGSRNRFSKYEDTDYEGVLDKDDIKKPSDKKEILDEVKARQNLNETAFFYPDLKTDINGNISFEFTTPEALTKWKLMFLAHTKDTRAATLEKEIITQKKLSVTPNYPRFLREGDELDFQAKISNLTKKALKGSASFQILNAETNEDITSQFAIASSIKDFEVKETGNSVVSWKIKTPYHKFSSIIIKVIAKSGKYSDGEQIPVAVLSNTMILTDTVPIFVKEGETKTFKIDNLTKDVSSTAINFSNTLELKTNPVWEILFALPDLSDNLNISSDSRFNTWFADIVGTEIFKANPRMKAVFEEYKSADLLKSNLEKNQELKQVLLEETPWVLHSQSEAETMDKVARLFDVNAMKNSINSDWNIFSHYQNSDGGFPWLPGYKSSYSVSLYILKNLGKMNEWLKGGISEYQMIGQKEMVSKLINYIDTELEMHWKEKEDNPWSNFALDYLDTRRYWEKEYPLGEKGARLKKMIIERADQFKLTDLTFYGVHRAALIFDNYGLKVPSDKLINYLKETSVSSETQGAYWKKNLNDWGWYESKAVNHAGAIEALNKLSPKDLNFIEEAKVWLATQKETNSWGNSRTTAEIIYILMNSGKSWMTPEADKAKVIWGGKEIAPNPKTTGYLKQVVKSDKINQDLGEVTVTKPGPGIVQGGLFWQYYDDLSKVKSTETYIAMTREFYKKIPTENGEELMKITENSPLHVGDRVTVRMILDTDRPMQYVHLKDMRAAGLEPVDVLSGYQWKNNLGYYQATKDASTNFYIYYMPKGKYVFEYDLICNASGNFSSGFATLQNYYAPQMNARTKGDKIEIKNKP